MSDVTAEREADLFEARSDGTFELAWRRQERLRKRVSLKEEIHLWV